MLDDNNVGTVDRALDVKEIIESCANSADEILYRHVRLAMERNLKPLLAVDRHEGIALIVGGGPSVKHSVADLANRQKQGQVIFALNGAAKWLADNGIIADYLVLMDARPFMKRFVMESPKETKLLIGSQAHPAVFDAAEAEGRDVTLWHHDFQGKTGVENVHNSPLIGPGTTVGLAAMQLAAAMGYFDIHLYGMDSSYEEGEGHVYPQPENADDEIMEVTVGDTTYHAAVWMVVQVEAFRDIARAMADLDCIITVHGTGLLPHVAQGLGEWPVKDGTLTMLYDLAKSPVGFNFLEWILTADILKTQVGAERLKVVFAPGPNEGFRKDTLPESLALRKQMYERVVKPAIALIGAEDGGIGGQGGTAPYIPRAIVEKVRDEGQAIPRFKATNVARDWAREYIQGKRPIVITLREAEHWPDANSDLDAWIKFAKWAQQRGESVIFVRDTAKMDEPIPGFVTCSIASYSLDRRCALYEVAKLNMMKCNGPYILASCVEGDVPLLIFGVLDEGHITLTPENWERLAGLKVGEQFPWYTERQRLVWDGRDDFETLKREYERILPLL